MLPSRSHQEPKSSAGAAAGDGKVDEPASEYARLERLVVAWLVGDSILFTFAALSKIESRGRTYTTHLEMMTWPICMSLMLLYFFGTLDSSAVGRRALVIWVAFWLHHAVFLTIHHWSKGDSKIWELFGAFLWNAFIGAALGWLMNLIRSELRALDSLDTTRITTRLLEIMGLQTAVGVIAVTQGIGPKAEDRLAATGLFQLSLCMAWLFSIAIFDVSGIDPHLAATKLRLGLVEGSALFFTGLMVLCGFSAYVLSEQSQPNVNTVETLWGVFAAAIFGGFCCTARVVWVARRRRWSKVCDSDPEPPA